MYAHIVLSSNIFIVEINTQSVQEFSKFSWFKVKILLGQSTGISTFSGKHTLIYTPCVLHIVCVYNGINWHCHKYMNPQIDPGWFRHSGSAQSEMKLLRYKTQCQTILLYTSFKLRFNGHIITSPPMKFK